MTPRRLDHRGRTRVVVTGVGVKTPAGNDVDAFWEHVLAGRAPRAASRASTPGLPRRASPAR